MNYQIPPHGTPARYVGNQQIEPCRCPACRRGACRVNLQCAAERIAGNPRRIPIKPVWGHVLELRDSGLTDAEIARAAGLPRRGAITKLGGQKTVGRGIAKAVLAVPVGYWPEGADVPALGAARRVQALMVRGHTGITIAELARTEHWRIFKLTSGEQGRVSPELNTAIRAIYEQLRHQPGDCPRIATIAAQNGWHGPDAWDDIDDRTEDPNAVICLDAVALNEERATEVQLLAAAGNTFEVIAHRIGISPTGVRQILRRENPNLYLELTA